MRWHRRMVCGWTAAIGLVACGVTPEPAIDLPELPALDHLEESVGQQFRERYDVVERLLAAEKRNNPALGQAFGSLGMVYHAYRDLEAARISYRNARSLDPDEFRWAYLLGFIERRLGGYSASDGAFDAALALRPGDLPTLVWRAENAFDQNRFEEAEQRFSDILQTSPECVQARYGKARVALEVGDAQQALGDLELAHAAQPGASPILYTLGLAHRTLGDLEQATSFFDRVPRSHLVRRGIAFEDPLIRQVRALERGAMAHEHRGLKAAAQGRFGVAAAELREAIALDGDRVEARHNLALALLRLGRQQEARRQIDEILERAPEFAPTHVLLSRLLSQEQAWGDAEEHLRQAVTLDPGSAKAHLALAELLDTLGRSDEAQAFLERAQKLDPALLEPTPPQTDLPSTGAPSDAPGS